MPLLYRCPVLVLVALSLACVAQEVTELPELVVESAPTADEPPANATSLAQALESHPELHLLPQGVGGQSDLSIQGSSFSGAGLCLDGLALRNPQTEHFHGELPVLPDAFGQITTRTGIQQQALTSTHLAGSVDLGLAEIVPRGRLSLGVGEFSAWESALYAAQSVSLGQGTLGLAAFAASNAAAGDPWRDNGLRGSLGGAHIQYRLADWRMDLLAAHGEKTFGARGYYGAPASLPSEENLRDSLLFLSAQRGDPTEQYIRFAFAWRELRDLYLLDASRPSLYRNEHRSRLLTLAADGRLMLDEAWSVVGRAELEREDLDSTYRGSIAAASLGRHWRARGTALVMPEYRAGNWRFAAGLRATGFTDDQPAWLPAAGVTWSPQTGTELSLAYSETVRLPSYTELNYDSPSSLGNAGLDRQRARGIELNATTPLGDSCRLRSQAFWRRETNAVDWVKDAPGAPWQATNLLAVDVLGVSAGLAVDLGPSLRLELDAQVLRKRTDSSPYSSRYTLDYPEAEGRAALVWQAASWCEIRATQTVSHWRDNPERDTTRTVSMASLAATLHPPRHPQLSLELGLDNAWDQEHQPVVGVDAPGRRARVSVAYEW